MHLHLAITPLNPGHDRKSFSCGEDALDQYLHRYATQDSRRSMSRVFVASSAGEPRQVVGYYSLSAGSLDASALPEHLRRRLPRYPIPVARLGRLAVAESRQRQGVGSILLADALKRIALASQVIAVYAVVVDARNERAGVFYRQFGFIPLPSQPQQLFLTLDSVTELLSNPP